LLILLGAGRGSLPELHEFLPELRHHLRQLLVVRPVLFLHRLQDLLAEGLHLLVDELGDDRELFLGALDGGGAR
jgi:hypothetical protein